MHRDGYHTKQKERVRNNENKSNSWDSRLYYIEISCTTLWRFE
jgi:hypothetical protein